MPSFNPFDKIAWIYNPLMKLSGRPNAYYSAIRSIAGIGAASSVLDVGGGTGLIANYFVSDAGRVVVLDSSKKMLSKIESEKIEKILGTAQDIKFPDNTFDLVYCVDSFHHFTNGHGLDEYSRIIDLGIREMLRVLKPGGFLVVIEVDIEKPLGKTIAFFENKIMHWGSCFWTRNEFGQLFSSYYFNVYVSDLDACCFIAKLRKK